jgi:hypothetical protein
MQIMVCNLKPGNIEIGNPSPAEAIIIYVHEMPGEGQNRL